MNPNQKVGAAWSSGSFGVADLLGPKAKIYYEMLASSKGLGRVSDLVRAQLGKILGENSPQFREKELAIRACLLYATAEGLRYREGRDPITLECGVVQERCAVSASFTLARSISPGPSLDWSQLESEVAPAEFRQLLRFLATHASRVVLKWHEISRRMEFVLEISLTTGSSVNASLTLVEWLNLNEVLNEAPPVQEYEALAELPRDELLQDEIVPITAAPEPEAEKEAPLVISGSEPEKTGIQFVKGSAPEDEGEMKLKSLGGAAATGAGPSDRPKGESNVKETQSFLDSPQARQFIDKINELQEKMKSMESERARLNRELMTEKNQVKNLQKLIDHASKAPNVAAKSTETANESTEDVSSSAEDSAGEKGSLKEVGQAADGLVQELESGGLAGTIDRIKAEGTALQQELKSKKAEQFIERSMADLMTEKAKLNEMAKKMTATLREKEAEMMQREVNYKNQERAKNLEIRNLDRAIKQRDLAAEHLKDQLAQANAQVEKAKQQVLASAGDGKGKQAATAEVSSLNIKLERSIRQLDEFRKANQQLSDRLADVQKNKDANGSNIGEVKSKLEAATKMLNLTKKQNDQLKISSENSRKEELRLKAELNKMQAELQTLKSLQAKAQNKANVAAAEAESKAAALAASKAAKPGAKKVA